MSIHIQNYSGLTDVESQRGFLARLGLAQHSSPGIAIVGRDQLSCRLEHRLIGQIFRPEDFHELSGGVWATALDGTGKSPTRTSEDGYGNGPLNWLLAEPTPAQ